MVQSLIDDLKKVPISQLTPLSQKLIHLPENQRDEFIKENSETKLERLSVIVAITTINKNLQEPKSPMCLVIATESGDVFILDSQSFALLHEVKVKHPHTRNSSQFNPKSNFQAKVCSFKATPDQVSASGSYNSDFKIVIATR